MSRERAVLAVMTAFALVAALPSPTASAAGPASPARDPQSPEPAVTVWTRARRPDAERRRELLTEALSHEIKAHHLLRSRSLLDRADVTSHLARAAILLEEAGASTSGDLFVRYRLASVYTLQEDPKKALGILESIGRADPPAPLRANVFADLAVTYAHLGRVQDEIDAYGESLRVQPIAHERARLLANRAEAYMLLGDITAAVAGYRAALGLLSADHMMFGTGATTLWGLAVALDRSGDLDSGLDAIRVARSYDPQDKMLNGPGWFYLPDYDRHWYEALGHWQVARKAEVVTSVRVDAYARAVASWEEYLSAAARDDKWLALARVRLKQCEKERAAFLRRPVNDAGLVRTSRRPPGLPTAPKRP